MDPLTQQAREHYQEGEKLFALGRFRQAMHHYEAAFEAKPLPELLFNIGQCHRNLGNYESAVFSFRQYLKHKPDAPNREDVLALIQELEAEMQASGRTSKQAAVPDGSTAAAEPAERTPLYSRWWLWTGVAVVATAAIAFQIADSGPDIPNSDLGNVDFGNDRSMLSSRGTRSLLLGLGTGLRW